MRFFWGQFFGIVAFSSVALAQAPTPTPGPGSECSAPPGVLCPQDPCSFSCSFLEQTPIQPVVTCLEQEADGSFLAGFTWESDRPTDCDFKVVTGSGCGRTFVYEPLQMPISSSGAFGTFFSLVATSGPPIDGGPVDRGQRTEFALSAPLSSRNFFVSISSSELTPTTELRWTIRSFVFTGNDERFAAVRLSDIGVLPRCRPQVAPLTPQNFSCQGATTSTTFSVPALPDPSVSAGPFTYLWSSTNCATADVPTFATPLESSTTVSTTAPGFGRPLSCDVSVTVTDSTLGLSTTRRATLGISACPLDCNNTPLGTATLDLCGVCGGTNQCLDCAGTPFGLLKVDRCGECGGDGTSCLGCISVSTSGTTGDLALSAARQARHVRRGAQLLRSAPLATPRDLRLARQRSAESRILRQELETLLKGLPINSLTCSNQIFCTQQDLFATKNEALRIVRQLRRLALKNRQLGALRGGERILLRSRIRSEFRRGTGAVNQLPDAQSKCTT